MEVVGNQVKIPDGDMQEPSFEELVARGMFDGLYADADTPGEAAGNILGLPFGFAARIAAVFSLASALQGAGSTPAVRELTTRANMHAPNAIPSASDLVRFELREVFRELDRADQLKEPPSEAFKDAMKKLGYDEFWADSYWAAHWELPSATQGFEMFHRLRPDRVPAEIAFDEAALRKLLKKLDVLHEYRDRLTAIAYNPMTRVDLRRIYALGLMSEQEVYERHLDLGYAPDDARLMTEFTKSDYDPDEKALTAGLLREAYQADIIDDTTLAQRLSAIGIGLDARAIIISLEAAKKQKAAQRAADQLAKSIERVRLQIRKQSRAGKLDEELITLALTDLGMSEAEAGIFIATNRLEPLPKDADLTRAQIIAAWKAGVLTEERARADLLKLGYDDDEADVILGTEKAKMTAAAAKAQIAAEKARARDAAAAQKRAEQDAAKRAAEERRRARPLTKAEIISAFKAGVLLEDEARADLALVGVQGTEADVVIATALASMQKKA